MVEALNQIIEKATSLNLWSDIGFPQSDVKITYLQYADDTLIFCEANIDSLMNIKRMLVLFQLASGLQVNFHKSSLIGINTSSEWLTKAATSLLGKTSIIPFTCLGLPIVGKASRAQLLDPIIATISKRIAT